MRKNLQNKKNGVPLHSQSERLQSSKHNAEIAQLVEHNLAKVGVASSSLVFRSKWKRQLQAVFFRFALLETMARTERPQVAPPRGWGCKYNSREIAHNVG